MTRDEILEHIGADSWDIVSACYFDRTSAEIEDSLDRMFPYDNNNELACSIADELRESDERA